jgi:carboxyl-terminal processing protease
MRRTACIAGVVALLAGAFALGLLLTRAHGGGGGTLAASSRDPAPELIDEVRQDLRNGYYRAIPPAVLASESVDQLISRLRDPYTDYLTPSEYASLRARTASSYSGVGLTVGPGKSGLIVRAAMHGPARAAGIRPGDRIVSIDGHRVRRLPFDRSLELIKGKEGTVVRLTIRRPREGTLSFSVRRQEIALPTVRSRLLRAGGAEAGYVQLLSFRASAADVLSARVARLVKRGAKGLVVDLRDNPGGLLSQAVRTVSVFIESGVVCMTEGAHYERRVYAATGHSPYPRLPLVVLVDHGSASAAEIVAAALGAHGRAVVVGERTYGKASVQSIRELSNGAALKLTSAVFYTPSGVNLTERGLRPDVGAVDDPRTRGDEALAAGRAALAKIIAR